MKPLVISCAYNEIKYIPQMVDYYASRGCDLLIADNYSTDGTYEWLMENEVPCIRVDTQNSFHIGLMQKAFLEKLKEINPDWILYSGVDTFYIFPNGIIKEIQNAEESGSNAIMLRHWEIYNTGEDVSEIFYSNYFYGKSQDLKIRIAKYDESLYFKGDSLLVSNIKASLSRGLIINYGMCKPKEEREEVLTRRQKAWSLGLEKRFGNHYNGAHKKDWIWDREMLTDIRTIPEWETIQKQLKI